MDIYDRIEMLLTERNMKQSDLARETGISTGLISQWKNRSQQPSSKKLQIVADCFEVSVDYLLGKDSNEKKLPTLTKKDERDIAKKLDETLHELQLDQDGLLFDGEPLDDLTKELLIQSLKNGLELSKRIAKEKYTPKKYRKDI